MTLVSKRLINFFVKSSIFFSVTINLLADMQLCPEFRILPSTHDSTAWFISASSKIIYGSLPPSSKTVFFKYSPAIFATSFPVEVLPVTATPDTLLLSIILATMVLGICKFLKTYSEKPASLKQSSIALAQP